MELLVSPLLFMYADASRYWLAVPSAIGSIRAALQDVPDHVPHYVVESALETLRRLDDGSLIAWFRAQELPDAPPQPRGKVRKRSGAAAESIDVDDDDDADTDAPADDAHAEEPNPEPSAAAPEAAASATDQTARRSGRRRTAPVKASM